MQSCSFPNLIYFFSCDVVCETRLDAKCLLNSDEPMNADLLAGTSLTGPWNALNFQKFTLKPSSPSEKTLPMQRQRRRPGSSSSKTLFCCFLSDTLLHLCFVSVEDSTFCESYGIVACTHTLCVVHSAAKSAKIQPFQLCKYHVRSRHKWHTISPLLFHQIAVDPMFSSKIWTSDASVYHTNHPGNSGSSDQILQQCTTQLRHTITIFIDLPCSAF